MINSNSEEKILIVVATFIEIEEVLSKYPFQSEEENKKYTLIISVPFSITITILITGIGAVNTAYRMGQEIWSAKYLIKKPYSRLFNFGIAGSYNSELSPGMIIEIIRDNFADLGAEDHDNFMDLKDMGFPILTQTTLNSNGVQQKNIIYNAVSNNSILPNFIEKLKLDMNIVNVVGITVNSVSGKEDTIRVRKSHHNTDNYFLTESMESAAFFLVSIAEKIPFHAFRAISNYVEPRDKSRWQIGKAIKELNLFIIKFIASYTNQRRIY